MDTGLPDGWTIERVRSESMDPEAEFLSLDRFVAVELFDFADYLPLRAEAVLSFHGLCLVLEDGEWYMGQLDDTDGSIICWACCGSDLREAISAL